MSHGRRASASRESGQSIAPREVYFVVKLERGPRGSVGTLCGQFFENVHEAADLCALMMNHDRSAHYELRMEVSQGDPPVYGCTVVLRDGTAIVTTPPKGH